MRDRRRAARATRPACGLLLLAAAACSTIFGTRHRDVQIEVDPTVFRVVHYHQAGRPDEQTSESLEDIACLRDEPASCWVEELITATIRNEGSHEILRVRNCMDPLRRVVDGVLDPPRYLLCISIPSTPIPSGEALVELVDVRDAESGIYRVGFTLSDEDGELPEGMSLSEPFELRR